MKIMGVIRNPFIRAWVCFNFLGWLLGMILGPILYYLVLFPYVSYNLYDTLEPVFFSFPVGIGSGVLQQSKLRQWKISSTAWTFATALGLGVPITFISWFLVNAFGSDISLLAVMLEIFAAGLLMGGLQAVLLRKLISKSGLWILTYGFGLLAVAIMIGMVAVGAFWIGESFTEFLYVIGLGLAIEYHEVVLLLIVAITFPVIAAFFIGLPTGIILQWFGNKGIYTEEKETSYS